MKKYTIRDVTEIIQSVGLGYAVGSYLSHKHIEDKELSVLWKQCHEAIQNIDREPYYEAMRKIEDRLRGYYE
ncbi:hypothetical protein EEL30_21805 [Brevibacillus laterosporus]|uniref:Uncharacterized protein n=1 Tax=Brevibacillus laterosporus TaxID=1465 RepID=A0A518VCI2_BRELA|nr:hypothetical protein EEL30_21805 [Brevibacillus laterosporus]